uniref:Amino acid transporter n=1 Tax=Tetraselmis sp. GSL018 TaxID=582737 RepID=A0A061QYC5_9CHLO
MGIHEAATGANGPQGDSNGPAEVYDLEPLISNSIRPHRHRVLKLLPLVALIFYEVSGGPFGIEDAVSTGGPLLSLLGFIVLPVIWSIPEALVTAELASTFPENSGYVAWVTEAFGPFWGFLEGLFSWISGVTDNAIYPVMFLTYLDTAWPAADLMSHKRTFLVGISSVLTLMNWRGLTLVGGLAVAFTFVIIVPFAILVVLGAPQIKPSNWLRVDWETVDWGGYINVMFWNLNYWDSASTLACRRGRGPGEDVPTGARRGGRARHSHVSAAARRRPRRGAGDEGLDAGLLLRRRRHGRRQVARCPDGCRGCRQPARAVPGGDVQRLLSAPGDVGAGDAAKVSLRPVAVRDSDGWPPALLRRDHHHDLLP